MNRWLKRLQPSEAALQVMIALVVGLAGGAGVWLFKFLIRLVNQLFYGGIGATLAPWGGWTVALLPVLGGLVVGLIVHFFIGEERHHGVAGVMEAVALAGGRLRYKRLPAKTAAAIVSIGAGASVGPEDPSVQIGANLGSMFGQRLHLSDDRVRTLVAAGAASGISAAFNAPIAGVFFALELVLGEISGGALGVVVIASVVSAVFTQAVSGPQPAFSIPSYTFNSVWELPLYLVLGLLAGPVAVAYIRLLYGAQDAFHHLPRIPHWAKPMIAGLIVGIAGLFVPQALGVGYDTIQSILTGQITGIVFLLVLMVTKLVLTSVSIGGGFVGGVFAPSLFIGSALGGAFGELSAGLFPGLHIQAPAYAMVGMAAVLAGAVHAPLTAILLPFEMTNDYRVILPLMFAVVVSLVVSQRLNHDSIYTLGLARKGIRLQRGRDVEVLETVTVGEVMQPAPFTLLETDTLSKASELFLATRHHGVPVVDQRDELVGIITIQDLDKIPADNWPSSTISEACTRDIQVTYPEESIGSALRRMGRQDVGRLPVVSRDNPRHLLGLLRRADLVRAYDAALTRRAAIRHIAHQVRLDAITESQVSVEEVHIQPGSACDGRLVKEIPWPQDCIITSLRRGREVLIPHGDTLLQAGDLLVAVAERPAKERLHELCYELKKDENA
jgi:chloride channel protein, CIC family